MRDLGFGMLKPDCRDRAFPEHPSRFWFDEAHHRPFEFPQDKLRHVCPELC